jgi:sigma-54 dependent transcriptional regulator, acetoin dehydrogenase operon transcriptional activator AcoR
MLAICEDKTVRPADLPADIRSPQAPTGMRVLDSGAAAPAAPATPVDESISLQAAERDALTLAIKNNRGHMTAVAAQLGISRNTLYRKIKRHGIRVSRRLDGI